MLESARFIYSRQVRKIKLKRQIRFYQRKVDEAPKIEQELLSLKRDYENVQNTYNSLLNRKLEADISANLEKKQNDNS